MNKAIKIIYIALFVAACCTPAALFPFFASEQSIGKEDRAELPALFDEDGLNKSFSDQFNLWFSQHMPFRPEVISVKNYVDSGWLGRATNDVIVGREGQLFYTGETDDYTGVVMSERRLHNSARTVYLMQQYCERNGAKFRFMCVPNKSTVYGSYMPAGYKRGETSNLQLMQKAFVDMKIDHVDVAALMQEHVSDSRELYLRDDTHWTNYGALLAYDGLRASFGYEDNTDLSACENRCDWRGDLAKMLYPSFDITCDQYYYPLPQNNTRFIKPRKSGMNEQAILENLMGDSEAMDTIIQATNRSGKGKAYISRDSFFRALLPYAINSYSYSYITRFRSFDLRDMQDGTYTDVIYETAERNLVKLTDEVPLIYALKTDEMPAGAKPAEVKELKVDEADGEYVVYGLLDEAKTAAGDNIYIAVSTENGTEYYEAFPISENERLELEESSDYGFSARFKGKAPDVSSLSVVTG